MLGAGWLNAKLCSETTARVDRCTLKEFLLARPTRTSTTPHCAIAPRYQPTNTAFHKLPLQAVRTSTCLFLSEDAYFVRPLAKVRSAALADKDVCEVDIDTVFWIDRGSSEMEEQK
jgi:hypothetical protein